MTNGIALLPCPCCGTPPQGPTRMSSRLGPDWLINCPACLLKLERYAETGGGALTYPQFNVKRSSDDYVRADFFVISSFVSYLLTPKPKQHTPSPARSILRPSKGRTILSGGDGRGPHGTGGAT